MLQLNLKINFYDLYFTHFEDQHIHNNTESTFLHRAQLSSMMNQKAFYLDL